MSRVDESFAAAIAAHTATLQQSRSAIERAAGLVSASLSNTGKLLVFGNGGSAADAQHLAAELVNRLQADRRAYAAIALTTDTSILTSIANDSSYERVFARQIEALGRPGDVALGISTSGRSPNVLQALEDARSRGLTTMALVGSDASAAARVAELCITVPAQTAARVQEVHRTILHVLCELIEATLG